MWEYPEERETLKRGDLNWDSDLGKDVDEWR